MRHGWRPAARLAVVALGLIASGSVRAGIDQSADAFVGEVFGSPPPPRVLWLTKALQVEARAILGHVPPQLRQRYWSDGRKSVWILEEIGREDPITAGFVIIDGRIDHVRVLAYRETRGGEVRQSSFLRQFHGAGLSRAEHLDRPIDGIVGATLSVRAMERMARLALYFDRKSRE